ncbi:transcriptional regulator [Sphingopyxis alaskensis]|jgi:hypothetical protein|uniref:transcriptional regulator n=1 Tax=Sphingopyxis alaskensis TaxID=117207 RepID=UPI002041B550|nr:transcriptional regulator [Sphingopyxis alaskensis]MCM3420814.1 transcriptional regulator [Sphingopyxis alaskensis]
MHHPTTVARPANQSLARVLAHAIDAAGKPRHRIASECGMHRETLLRVARGERPIGLDEAALVLAACGAHPRATMILALAGQEELACEWMHGEMGEFLEEFFTSLPVHLQRTLGRRIEDLRPRWANGTSQLVARMLAKHIDDFVGRDIVMSLSR